MKSCLGIGCLLTLLATVALAVTMIITCPKPDQHYEALNEVVGLAIDDQISHTDDLVTQIAGALGRVALDKVGQHAIERIVRVDNYYVVSIGRMQWRGEQRIVSVGIFGQVITPSKEQITEAARKAF